jgi:RecA-family ATPase
MRPTPPHNASQAFEDGFREASDRWERGEPRQEPQQRGLPTIGTLSPVDWTGKEAPAYDWMVEGCFLRGTVAMMSGDGGLGKSLLMQQLLTAAAVGRPWLGLDTQPARGYAFFCEDDEGELHRRQERINDHYEVSYAELGGVRYASRVGQENVLVEFDRRTDQPRRMPLFDALAEDVKRHQAQIVVLDTLADVFAGNEIVRNQVRRFVTALRKLAMEIQGVIILTAHPSLSGMATGSGISGSTAWNNSVRSRIYLTKPKSNDEEEEDHNERLLRTMKNNQGPFGGALRLRWRDGVFVRSDMVSSSLDLVGRLDLIGAVLKAVEDLCRTGTRMSPDKFARTYVVTALAGQPSLRPYTRGQVESAKDALLADGRLVQTTIKRDRKDRIYVKPASMTLPEEEGGKP